MNERQLIDYLMSEMRHICAITPDFDGEEDDDSAMASELSGCLGTAQRVARRAIREGDKRIAGLPAPSPASEGEVDRLPLLMAKQACDLIRTLCIVELHIPKADARLDQISDAVDLLRGHLNALTPSASDRGGVVVTEEMVERALTSGPIPNYCNFGHLLKRAGIANGQDWMRAALEAAIGGGGGIERKLRMAEHECQRLAELLSDAQRGIRANLTVTSMGGMCPTQAEGFIYGHAFYFRARHGDWELTVSPTGEDPVRNKSPVYYAEGVDDTHGDMSFQAVLAVIGSHMPGIYKAINQPPSPTAAKDGGNSNGGN